MWRHLIDSAKTEFRIHLATRDAFPAIDDAKQHIIARIVKEILKHFKRNHLVLEDRMFPRYEQELYNLVSSSFLDNRMSLIMYEIYNDASTFRCEIKKLCFRHVIELYQLNPPSNIRDDEAIRWVRTRASDLIQGAQFLRGPPNDEVSSASILYCFLY